MPFDHADFTRSARELVAESDRVPEQRGPRLKAGDRVLLVREGRAHILHVEDVQPAGEGMTLTVTPVEPRRISLAPAASSR